MNADAAIRSALVKTGLSCEITSARQLSGGCIHNVKEITLDDGMRAVVKIASARDRALFTEEAAGLRALGQTQTVLVPEPLTVVEAEGAAVLLMTAFRVGSATEQMWRNFGSDLAALHAADAGTRYGFAIDNHLGTTFQPNTWCDDWVEFNARYRLGYQLELAQQHARIETTEALAIEKVINQLDRLLPQNPKSSLLHGDLWSGNALPVSSNGGSGRIALIDPACSIGDGWADIAMMKLFGGFPDVAFAAYAHACEDHDRIDARIHVYQLYHVLNHLNIFGRGYAAQAMALVQSLTSGA